MLAVRHGHLAVVSAQLTAKADANTQANDGGTALMAAAPGPHRNVAENCAR